MKTTMEELAPYMRGWRSYFGFCETPEVLVALDSLGPVGDCGPLCGVSGKHARRRRAALIALQVFGQLCNTADSGRGPMVHQPGAKPCSVGLSNAHFKSLGLPSYGSMHVSVICSNRRGTDPYARWCGRGGAARLPPIPIFDPDRTMWALICCAAQLLC